MAEYPGDWEAAQEEARRRAARVAERAEMANAQGFAEALYESLNDEGKAKVNQKLAERGLPTYKDRGHG